MQSDQSEKTRRDLLEAVPAVAPAAPAGTAAPGAPVDDPAPPGARAYIDDLIRRYEAARRRAVRAGDVFDARLEMIPKDGPARVRKARYAKLEATYNRASDPYVALGRELAAAAPGPGEGRSGRR